MKYLLSAFILISSTAFAQDMPPPMRDMSMPPDETMQDIYRGPQEMPPPADEDMMMQEAPPPGIDQQGLPLDHPTRSSAFSGFMEGYCDPGFRPRLAGAGNRAAVEACIDSHKQSACGQFQKLPQDVRPVLDDTIGCLYTAGNNDTGALGTDPGCSDNDSHRMKLLEKYWNDAFTAHALVFLPDEVLNAPGECIRKGK